MTTITQHGLVRHDQCAHVCRGLTCSSYEHPQNQHAGLEALYACVSDLLCLQVWQDRACCAWHMCSQPMPSNPPDLENSGDSTKITRVFASVPHMPACSGSPDNLLCRMQIEQHARQKCSLRPFCWQLSGRQYPTADIL